MFLLGHLLVYSFSVFFKILLIIQTIKKIQTIQRSQHLRLSYPAPESTLVEK